MAHYFRKSKSLRKHPTSRKTQVVSTRLKCVGTNRLIVSHMAREAARDTGCTARQACHRGNAAAVVTCRPDKIEDFKDQFYRDLDRARRAEKALMSGKKRRR